MDQNILGRDESCRDQTGASPKQANKSLTNSSKCRNRSQQQQQPGKYLCVDTRKEQVYVPRVRPHSSYTHNFSSPNTRLKHFSKDVLQNNLPTKNLKILHNRTVQPDSHCKFKTTLAIDYVRDIVEENAKNSRPRSRQHSLKRNGHLKPLLATGQPSLEPNVKKCLGIQNDRQKKMITLDDGLEVREAASSPGSTRFSSAAKNISQTTLTIDLRKLSLVSDQDESIASDNGITYEERAGIDSTGFLKNPKSRSIIMSRKNIESKIDGSDRNQDNNNKSTGVRHWSEYSHNHIVDDIDDDQGIDDTINHSYKYGDHVDVSGRELDYNRADIDETGYIDDIRDNSPLEHDLRGSINDDMSSSDDIGDDDEDDEEDTRNHQSHQGQNTFEGSDRHFTGFEENVIQDKRTRTNRGLKSSKLERKLIYANGNLMSTDDNSCITVNEESNPKIFKEEKFSKPDKTEEMTSTDLFQVHDNSATTENEPCVKNFYNNRKPANDDSEICRVSHPKSSDNDMSEHNINVHLLSSSSDTTTTPSFNPSIPDHNTKQTNENQWMYPKSHSKHLDMDKPQQNITSVGPGSSNSTNSKRFSDHNPKPTSESQRIYHVEHPNAYTSAGLGSPTNSTTPYSNFPDHNPKPTSERQRIYQDPQAEYPKIDRPPQNTSVGLGSPSSTNSTTPFSSSPHHNRKPTDEKQGIHQELQMENPNIDKPRQYPSTPLLASSSNSTIPSLNPSTPDQDSIQVKDIWKALVDGGYDIAREEISKYKVNSTKRRIRSAPPRRGTSQNSTIVKDVQIRAKSAVNREERLRKKGCFEDLTEDGDSVEIRKKNPTLGRFIQEQTSINKLKPSKESLYDADQSSLEVVAVSKPVTKLPRKKIPLVLPLNFQINTMPKSDHFFYFAYGLNMNQKRLEIQLRCKTGFRYWGLLFGFRLVFNKKGSAQGGVGFPNIVHEPGFSVEGCVYELSLDCLPLLDTCVGFPKHYSRLVIPVWLCNSLEPAELGVAQHCVPALVYIAQDDWVASDPTTLDTSFTLKQCALGTDLLTSNYQQFLESFNVTDVKL